MNTAFILLGGNLGNMEATFAKACKWLEIKVGTICNKSSNYQTAPWGFESNLPFLNQVVKLETALTPSQLMHELLSIESSLGRTRGNQLGYQSRTIDLDILFYNQAIIDLPHLEIPHPRLHLRRFTLLPLSEIATDYFHPTLQKTVSQLLAECEDQSEAKKL